MAKIVSTSSLMGAKVLGGKDGAQRIGKVHCCVFHPTEKRCIGFLVKRPDLLLMFHRPDSFVALDDFEIVDNHVQLLSEKGMSGEAACKKLGISWDQCVLWEGLAVCTEDGTMLGRAGSVSFNLETGAVKRILIDEGSTAAGVLLGNREIPASMIRGFRRGIGASLSDYAFLAEEIQREEESVNGATRRELSLTTEALELGALLVSNEAKDIKAEGGLAEKAGQATAVATNKVKTAVDSVKPKVSDAAQATGKAVNKGAYVTGRQISRAKGMFGAFKDEFNKARK